MKKLMLLAAISAASLAVFAKTSTPAGFTDDLDAALESAKKSGKTVYAVFSGSDWCYWCKVLEKNHLSKKEFVDEASKHFELVYIDSPSDKSKLSEKAAKRNPGLMEKYKIKGFPTVKFIAADGTASNASRPGKDVGPKAYAEQLAREVKTLPLVNKYIAPLKAEIDSATRPAFDKLMKIGDPFAKKTEAEQRAAYKEAVAALSEVVAKMKELRAKVEKTEVPAEIAAEKAQLLLVINQNAVGMVQHTAKTFEEAKAESDARRKRLEERRAKRKNAK